MQTAVMLYSLTRQRFKNGAFFFGCEIFARFSGELNEA